MGLCSSKDKKNSVHVADPKPIDKSEIGDIPEEEKPIIPQEEDSTNYMGPALLKLLSGVIKMDAPPPAEVEPEINQSRPDVGPETKQSPPNVVKQVEPEKKESEENVGNNNEDMKGQLDHAITLNNNNDAQPVVFEHEVVQATNSMSQVEEPKQRRKRENKENDEVRRKEQKDQEDALEKSAVERKKQVANLKNVSIEPVASVMTSLSNKAWQKSLNFDGLDYGQLVCVGDQIWLNKNVEFAMMDGKKVCLEMGKGPGSNGENESRYLPHCQKPGLRLPTKADFEKLFSNVGGQDADAVTKLKDPAGFNLKFDAKMVQVTSEYLEKNQIASYTFADTGVRNSQSWAYANSNDLGKYGVRLICDSKTVNTSELIGPLKKIKPSNAETNTVMINEVSNQIAISSKKTHDTNLYEIKLSIDATVGDENTLICWEFPGGITTVGRTAKYYFDLNSNPDDSVKTIKVQIEQPSLIMQDILNLDLNTLGDNEVIGDMDYGVPILIGTQIWLNKNVEYAMINNAKVCLIEGKGPGKGGENEISYVKSCAPMGWRPPMKNDFETLIGCFPAEKATELLKLKSGFALDSSKLTTIEKMSNNEYYAVSFDQNPPNLNARAWGYANSGNLAKYGVRLLSDAVTKPTNELIGKMKSTLPRLPGGKTMIKKVTGLIGIKMKQRTSKGNHKIIWVLQKELNDLTGRIAWSFGDGTEEDGKEVKHTYKSEKDFNVVIQLEAANCVYEESFTFNPGNVGDSEIYDGLDFGLPIKIGNQIWLNKDVEYLYNSAGDKLCCIMGKGPGSNGESESSYYSKGLLPPGWRLPSKADYETLMNNLKGDAKQKALELRNPSGFNLQLYNGSLTKKFMCSDKLKGDENKFNGLFVDVDSFSFGSVWKYSNSNSLATYGARLIADNNPDLMLEGDQDVRLKENCEMKLRNQNILKISWKFPDGSTANETSVKKRFDNLNFGSHDIKIEAELFGGRKTTKTIRPFFYVPKNLLVKPGKFNKSKIQIIDVAEHSYNSGQLHFERPCGVIAPNMEDAGFLFGLNHKDGTKSITSYDAKGQQIGQPKVNGKGLFQSICCTEWGYACMEVEREGKKNRQEVCAYDKNHKEKWRTNIMDNGEDVKTAKKQLGFFGDKKTPLFGSTAMFNPHNSCIYYAREKIFTIYAHYNNFDGVKDCHTGDTTNSFNSLTGKDELIGTSWGSSHSLEQHIYYENGWAYTVTLGDAWPQDIRMYKTHIHKLDTSAGIDATRKRQVHLMNGIKDQLTTEENKCPMPGAGDGCCSGRCGGLVSLDEHRLAVAYSLVSGTFQTKNGTVSHNNNEFGILIVRKDKMNVEKKIKLKSGTDVNQIRMVRYGDKIFLAYFYTKDCQKKDGMLNRWHFKQSNMHAYILDLNCNVVEDIGEIEGVNFNKNENFVTLNDGSVAWCYTEGNGGGPMKIYILRP